MILLKIPSTSSELVHLLLMFPSLQISDRDSTPELFSLKCLMI
jgi:hypothetical protein